MNMVKLWIVSALVLVVSASACFLYRLGVDYGEYRYAYDALKEEVQSIKEENEEIKKQMPEYSDKAGAQMSKDEKAQTLERLDSEISGYENEIQKLGEELETVKNEKAILQEFSESMKNISNSASGSPITLSNNTYQCPSDISEGRYKVTGDGSFRVVVNSSQEIIDSQLVSQLEGNMYTFNLKSGTRITVDGTLTFTPVK